MCSITRVRHKLGTEKQQQGTMKLDRPQISVQIPQIKDRVLQLKQVLSLKIKMLQTYHLKITNTASQA